MKIQSIITTLLVATAISTASAANRTVAGIRDYVYPNNIAQSYGALKYMPDGKEYAKLSDDGRTINVYNVRTGAKSSTIFDVATTREVEGLGSIEGFMMSPDASKILVWTQKEPIYRRSSTAKFYVYEVRTRLLRPLSREHKRQQVPVFSPDSRMVAFVADNNIYIKKLDYDSEVAVTTDGAPGKIINGATDWTYEEEFTLTSTLSWAPDNETLCYVRFDESEVPEYTLQLFEGACEPKRQYALYPGEFKYKYPVAGQQNSRVTLHSYDIDTRKTRNITLPDNTIEYIARIDFGNSPDRLMVCTLNRDQNKFEIYSVNPRTTVAQSVYVEKSKAWIIPETYEQIRYESDGFVVLTNASGRVKAVKYTYAGARSRDLTGSADYDVTAYYGQDAAGNRYYQAARPTPMDRTVWCINAKGIETCVSATDGTNSFAFSPDMAVAVYNHNDTQTPPVYTLVDPRGKSLRTLENNADYARTAKMRNVAREFFKVPTDGGLELNAYIMRPAGFDASKKYPVVMTQYSGPGSQSVLNKWTMDWEQYFAQNGFIVVCVDGRGTANRGNDFMYKVYGNLGYYETIDQINAARYVATLPGVDASRIGMCGWSYGGYETLMCATDPNSPFAAAVAIAPVTSWRYYDTVYTERYMMTPQENGDAYNTSAPVTRTANLKGNLLIMTGTADDNVHPANSYEFVSHLQNDGNFCDMLVFPNKNHSIYGCDARAVVYGKMFDYFRKNLK